MLCQIIFNCFCFGTEIETDGCCVFAFHYMDRLAVMLIDRGLKSPPRNKVAAVFLGKRRFFCSLGTS